MTNAENKQMRQCLIWFMACVILVVLSAGTLFFGRETVDTTSLAAVMQGYKSALIKTAVIWMTTLIALIIGLVVCLAKSMQTCDTTQVERVVKLAKSKGDSAEKP